MKHKTSNYRIFDMYPLRPYGDYSALAITPTAAVRFLYLAKGTEAPKDPYITVIHSVAGPDDLPDAPSEIPGLVASNPWSDFSPFLRRHNLWIDGDAYKGPDLDGVCAYLLGVCKIGKTDLPRLDVAGIVEILGQHKGEQPQTAGDRHSDDYSSVTWKGKAYTFAPTQARAVRVLWEAHQNGTPDVHQATIHEHIESASESQRLRDIFKGHPAWGTMIVSGDGKGMFRLS